MMSMKPITPAYEVAKKIHSFVFCIFLVKTHNVWIENICCYLFYSPELYICDPGPQNQSFFKIEIYTLSERGINNISIDVWFVMIRQYL